MAYKSGFNLNPPIKFQAFRQAIMSLEILGMVPISQIEGQYFKVAVQVIKVTSEKDPQGEGYGHRLG